MKRELIRKRFKQYRQEIVNLNAQLEDAYSYQEEAVSRANQRAAACQQECAERERQAELDRWDRDSQIGRATRELERARSYNDTWGEERALRKLKSIY